LALASLAASALEDLDELAADDLALGLGVGHAQPGGPGTARWRPHAPPWHAAAGEHLHHHRAFVQAQQAVVDEDAGQLVADGAVDQRRGHAGVDAARQAQDDLFVAHLLADARHRFGRCGRA
jgi:hypothetical protein